jgi:RES domain-containing protein
MSCPEGWQSWPWDERAQQVGTLWFDERVSVALSVPSAVVPDQRNYLLNPQHPDWDRVTVSEPRPFAVDARLSEPPLEG